MQHRTLGASGLSVSAIGLGCFGMSSVYGAADETESIATLHRALALGINFLDTSDVYGNGHNELLLGRALAGRWDEVVLATKFGNLRLPDGTPAVNGRPAYVREACERSLRRLGVERIDLYYLHRVDPDVPIEETIGAMARLVDEGKVRALGISEAAPATLRRAHATHPLAALQTEYSLFTREVEAEILPLCRELGIAFVAYSPLGRGLLGGKIRGAADLAPDDHRRIMPRYHAENLSRNLRLLGVLDEIAAARRLTAAQVALAWLLGRGPDVFPIPGTKRRGYLEENAAAAGVPLGAEDLARLDAVFTPDSVAGDRYPPAMLRRVNL